MEPCAPGPYALGDLVEGSPEFGVLLHEHQVQRIEHRTGHVPVETVGLGVEHGAVRQNTPQAFRNPETIRLRNANIDGRFNSHKSHLIDRAC